MNEFVFKKLAEVSAFAELGKNTIDKAFQGFRKLFTEVKLSDLQASNSSHLNSVLAILETAKSEEKNIFESKFQSTVSKLASMRDLYIQDKWDNPSELCEWLGFFEGGAVVHWTLVKGVAEALQNKALEELSDKAILFHEEILKTVSLSLYNTGKGDLS